MCALRLCDQRGRLTVGLRGLWSRSTTVTDSKIPFSQMILGPFNLLERIIKTSVEAFFKFWTRRSQQTKIVKLITFERRCSRYVIQRLSSGFLPHRSWVRIPPYPFCAFLRVLAARAHRIPKLLSRATWNMKRYGLLHDILHHWICQEPLSTISKIHKKICHFSIVKHLPSNYHPLRWVKYAV